MLSLHGPAIFSTLLLTGITMTGETPIEIHSNPIRPFSDSPSPSDRKPSVGVRFNHISSSTLLWPIQFLNSLCQKLASAGSPSSNRTCFHEFHCFHNAVWQQRPRPYNRPRPAIASYRVVVRGQPQNLGNCVTSLLLVETSPRLHHTTMQHRMRFDRSGSVGWLVVNWLCCVLGENRYLGLGLLPIGGKVPPKRRPQTYWPERMVHLKSGGYFQRRYFQILGGPCPGTPHSAISIGVWPARLT